MKNSITIGGSIIVCTIGFLLFFHIVSGDKGLILIPKEHATFSDCFINLDSIVSRYDNSSIVEKLQNNYLISKLKEKKLISSDALTLVTTEVKATISELPLEIVSYDHAMLAYIVVHETLATNLNQLVFDTSFVINNEYFDYNYNGNGKFTVSIKKGVTLGSLIYGDYIESTISTNGNINHTKSDNFEKYIPYFN